MHGLLCNYFRKYPYSKTTLDSIITTGLTREIMQRLKAKGLMDGVGLQMHIDLQDEPYRDIGNTFSQGRDFQPRVAGCYSP